jgi:hypothetical protein
MAGDVVKLDSAKTVAGPAITIAAKDKGVMVDFDYRARRVRDVLGQAPHRAECAL